jgi:hypothetical protein
MGKKTSDLPVMEARKIAFSRTGSKAQKGSPVNVRVKT